MSVKIIRWNELIEMVKLSRSTLSDKMNPRSLRYDASFPKRVHLGIKSVGWLEHEVVAWINSKQECDRGNQFFRICFNLGQWAVGDD